MVSPSFQRTFTAYLVPVSLAHCPPSQGAHKGRPYGKFFVHLHKILGVRNYCGPENRPTVIDPEC